MINNNLLILLLGIILLIFLKNSESFSNIKEDLSIKNTLNVLKNEQYYYAKQLKLNQSKALLEKNIEDITKVRDNSIINLDNAMLKLEEINLEIEENDKQLKEIQTKSKHHRNKLRKKINSNLQNIKHNILKNKDALIEKTEKNKTGKVVINTVKKIGNVAQNLGRNLIANLPI
jgi:hypothetical protein